MSCEKVQSLIEGYHCGELQPDLAAEVEAHLTSCAECAGRRQMLAREDAIYRSYSEMLDQELEVRPAMWQAVRSALPEDPSRRHSSLLMFFERLLPASRLARAAAFAAFVAAVSISATLLAVRTFGPQAGDRGSNAEYSASRNSLEAAHQTVRKAEAQYEQAILLLSEIVERHKQEFNAVKQAEIDRDIRRLDLAIMKARQQYQENPSDPELGFSMLTAYREKVELLQELAAS